MANEVITGRRGALAVSNGLTDGELRVTVGPSGAVTAAAGNAISGTGGGITISVVGEVRANAGTAVLLRGSDADLSNAVYVADAGRVVGRTAIAFDTFGSSVYNDGLISARSTGIQFGGRDTEEVSTIRNFGTIEARVAVRVTGATTEGVSIDNGAGGVIRSTTQGGVAIDADATTGLGLRLENGGLIVGAVRMGGTADTYVNEGGRVRGTIFGEGGRDVFLPGRSAERIDGGRGFDMLDFGDGAGVRVTLAGKAASNTGSAKGDSYARVEGAIGSAFGRDDLRGGNGANALDGQGGADRLSGARGNDALIGGLGRDATNGGLGNDAFVFRSLAEGGDRIADFGSRRGNDDRFRFDADGFDAALADGALAAGRFDSGRDNRAGDADDRFVFRTTDRTLWFDADGSGGSGPVLIADLQARANVTAADILIF